MRQQKRQNRFTGFKQHFKQKKQKMMVQHKIHIFTHIRPLVGTLNTWKIDVYCFKRIYKRCKFKWKYLHTESTVHLCLLNGSVFSYSEQQSSAVKTTFWITKVFWLVSFFLFFLHSFSQRKRFNRCFCESCEIRYSRGFIQQWE